MLGWMFDRARAGQCRQGFRKSLRDLVTPGPRLPVGGRRGAAGLKHPDPRSVIGSPLS